MASDGFPFQKGLFSGVVLEAKAAFGEELL